MNILIMRKYSRGIVTRKRFNVWPSPHWASKIDGYINWYAYVGNNPLKWTDPMGLRKTKEERQAAKAARKAIRSSKRTKRRENRASDKARKARKYADKARNAKTEFGRQFWERRTAGAVDRADYWTGQAANSAAKRDENLRKYNDLQKKDGYRDRWANRPQVPTLPDDTNTSVLQGNPYSGRSVTFPFGLQINPFTGESYYHLGTDYNISPNYTPALIGGVVNKAGSDSNDPNVGMNVQIKRTIGGVTFYSNTMHNSEVSVTVGDNVASGDIVAIPGDTGNTTGPHIHVDIFTYKKNSSLVQNMINARVPHVESGSRIFFEPSFALGYFSSNGIRY